MLKKIALVLMLALPMGVFAQNLKFGHINAQEIITVMPEFTKAQNDIQNLEKQLTAELQRTQEEFNKKYQEFQQAIAKDSLPANIAERRQKELQDMMQMYMKKRERERSLCFFSLSLLEFLTLIAYLIPRLAFTLLVRLMLNVSLT